MLIKIVLKFANFANPNSSAVPAEEALLLDAAREDGGAGLVPVLLRDVPRGQPVPAAGSGYEIGTAWVEMKFQI